MSDETKYQLVVEIIVNTNCTLDEWTDDFIAWVESRGEYFGGGINIYRDNDDE